jgi:hypothetical protein
MTNYIGELRLSINMPGLWQVRAIIEELSIRNGKMK